MPHRERAWRSSTAPAQPGTLQEDLDAYRDLGITGEAAQAAREGRSAFL